MTPCMVSRMFLISFYEPRCYAENMRRKDLLTVIVVFQVIVVMLCSCKTLSVNQEIENRYHEPTTENLIEMVEADQELKDMLEESIRLAWIHNPDPEYSPVKTLEDYYAFLDWSSKCMPWNILSAKEFPSLYTSIDQSLNYFYYLLDQPLPQLAGRGYYYPCLEYHEPIATWVKEYCKTWGNYLSTEDSWNEDYYIKTCNDPSFGMDNGWYAEENIWKSFNDYFSRKLITPSVRPIAKTDIVSPADSACQGQWSVDENSQIDMGAQLKSVRFYSVEQLIGEDSTYKKQFAGGTLTHTFLDVNDYHRYHFPVGGTILEVRKIDGLDAVGGIIAWDAIENRYALYDNNPGWQSIETRDCLIMDTEFGLVAILPIGMSQVSSCNWEESVVPGATVEKGDPMGYFLFGGSDIVMVFQKGVELSLCSPNEHVYMGQPYASISK